MSTSPPSKPTENVALRGGPLDGTIRELPVGCLKFQRHNGKLRPAKCLEVYGRTDETDEFGLPVFQYVGEE